MSVKSEEKKAGADSSLVWEHDAFAHRLDSLRNRVGQSETNVKSRDTIPDGGSTLGARSNTWAGRWPDSAGASSRTKETLRTGRGT